MSEIKRYNCIIQRRTPEGPYVLASDYDALATRLAAADNALAELDASAIRQGAKIVELEQQREQDRQRIEELERDKVGAAGQIMALVCKAAKERDDLKQRLAALEQEVANHKKSEELLAGASINRADEIVTLTLALAQARKRLDQLARLGNGERWGNSDGNRIAQDALAEIAALDVPAAGGGGDVCRVALERIWRMLNCSDESPFCDDRTHGNLKHHDCHIHEIRDTVLHALAAAPTPGLVWTTEPPTVPGWYWWRDCETREAEVCEVYTCQLDGRTLRVNWTTDCYTNGTELAEYDLGHWAGPLSLPKEA